ncbi:MAG TPA: outer-membrane lipoprotein carrier protein LolA [Methyloceanibacter sp.]|nr:outer-membrane lipoprotein carrier protein LolA [Methyloceanibacter sp.]
MTRRSAAGGLAGLPIALSFTIGLAFAQDSSTTVPKSPISTDPVEQEGGPPEDALRPSIGQEVVPADNAAPVGEITPSAIDEGASWEAAVEAVDAPTPLIGDAQSEAVQRINAYFNGITNLQGRFEQIDPSNKRSRGRFYVQRPGKIRFDYAPPSALRIVADGSSLAIEDSDLKTVEKYPIESTPFRLLLADTVDLGRDARIVGVERQPGELAISLEDSSGDAAGRIKLSFDAGSELELKEWMITDAQGLTTKVTVNNIVAGRKVAVDFFQSKDSFSPFR